MPVHLFELFHVKHLLPKLSDFQVCRRYKEADVER
jgi:hypothetical protein